MNHNHAIYKTRVRRGSYISQHCALYVKLFCSKSLFIRSLLGPSIACEVPKLKLYLSYLFCCERGWSYVPGRAAPGVCARSHNQNHIEPFAIQRWFLSFLVHMAGCVRYSQFTCHALFCEKRSWSRCLFHHSSIDFHWLNCIKCLIHCYIFSSLRKPTLPSS